MSSDVSDRPFSSAEKGVGEASATDFPAALFFGCRPERPCAAAPACRIPEAAWSVACGFPSPALDYRADDLDVGAYFVREPAATYAVTARGDSMADAGILDGDKLFVDRSLEPRNGDIVLAYYDGAFTVKRLRIREGRPELHPENERAGYPVLRPRPEELLIEGVVVSCGRTFR